MNTLPQQLQIALKEWATVCQALRAGRQMILLRKGGIHESAGEFELDHRSFVLFPTYLHQNAAMLKPEARQSFEQRSSEPDHITIDAAAHVTDIVQLRDRSQMDLLDAEHIWTPPLVDMRFNYRPKNPLYLLIVRAYVLPRPRGIENTPAYAGCKSWVPLEETFDSAGATPVIDEARFDGRRQTILSALSAAPT